MPNTSDNMRFPTVNQFKLMQRMYPNKEISFEDQDIFRQKQWFRREMEKLINWGRVEKINGFSFDGRRRIERYKLTLISGKIFFDFLINYDERNNHGRN